MLQDTGFKVVKGDFWWWKRPTVQIMQSISVLHPPTIHSQLYERHRKASDISVLAITFQII